MVVIPIIQGSCPNSCCFDHGAISRLQLLVCNFVVTKACLCKWGSVKWIRKFGGLYVISETVIYAPRRSAIASAICLESILLCGVRLFAGLAITACCQYVSAIRNMNIFLASLLFVCIVFM